MALLDRGDNYLPLGVFHRIDDAVQSSTLIYDAKNRSKMEHLTRSKADDIG
jgi:hypothetical protein